MDNKVYDIFIHRINQSYLSLREFRSTIGENVTV